MTAKRNDDRLRLACKVAREAGHHALSFFRDRTSLEIREKGLQDVVSQADIETEKLIREQLTAAYPSDGFLGEETSPHALDSRGGVWVVDPIDGTACFVAGIPTWCISIAFVRDGEIEIGVIYDPNTDELFHAARNEGAFLNGARISVSDAGDFSDGMMGFSFSHRASPGEIIPALERLLSAGGMFYRCGSGALTLAYVACGRLNAFFEPHMNSWDSCAGVLLVREAGGWVSDTLNGDGLTQGAPVLASTQGLARSVRLLVYDDR